MPTYFFCLRHIIFFIVFTIVIEIIHILLCYIAIFIWFPILIDPYKHSLRISFRVIFRAIFIISNLNVSYKFIELFKRVKGFIRRK